MPSTPPGFLPRGTRLRRRASDPRNDVVAEVLGTQAADPDGKGATLCYVLKSKWNTGGPRMLAKVGDVHRTWLLEGVSLERARTLVGRVAGTGEERRRKGSVPNWVNYILIAVPVLLIVYFYEQARECRRGGSGDWRL